MKPDIGRRKIYIRPYPKAGPRKTTHSKTRKGQTSILTDTPVRTQIQSRLQHRKGSSKPTSVAKVKKRLAIDFDVSMKKQKLDSKAASTSYDHKQYDNESNDASRSGAGVPEMDEFEFVAKDPSMQNITKGDFVLVAYATKKTIRHFVGVVLDKDVEDDTVEVKYLTRLPKKISIRFVYPENDDIDNVPLADIIMILPAPSQAGGTQRASKQYIFDINLTTFFHGT